jgi:hypothetical protein
MMRFELGPEKPNPKRAFVGATAIAGAFCSDWQRTQQAAHGNAGGGRRVEPTLYPL